MVGRTRTKQWLEEENAILRRENNAYRAKVIELEASAAKRIDDRMLQQHIALSASLGQMIEATSKAVMFIVGKESL